MNRIYIPVLFFSIVGSGCATAPTTAYRTPQVMISGATPGQVKLPIVQACVEGGGNIEIATDQQVICAKAMDGSFGSLLYRALATPQYSTNPVARARYTIVDSGGSIYVTVDTYLQNQNAYGQTKTTPIQNGDIAAKAQAMLDRIKASIESAPSIEPRAPASPKPTQPATPAPSSEGWRSWGQKDG